MVKRTLALMTLVSCLFMLTGCGQKGPLYLPQTPQKHHWHHQGEHKQA